MSDHVYKYQRELLGFRPTRKSTSRSRNTW